MQTSKCRASNVERNKRLRQLVTSAFFFTVMEQLLTHKITPRNRKNVFRN